MKYLFGSIVNTSKNPLGRWSTVYSSFDLQKRIDLANIDNCGPCIHSDIPTENKYKIQSGHFVVKKTKPENLKHSLD